MFQQVADPVAVSLALSALCAALPLATLFVLLSALHWKAWQAALASLAVALLVAIVAFGMPTGQAVLAGIEGAAFGLFPIVFIVLAAIWTFRLTEMTGYDIVLRRAFESLSADHRVQAILIAFCFGALLEALAGFGTPVAVTAVMLIAVGLKPIKAAAVTLVANTAPVAFGAIAVPITTLGRITGLDPDVLGAMVGRQTPILAVFVPFILVGMIDGRRGLRQTWPAALVGGLGSAVAQFVTSNFLAYEVADIVAAMVGALALVVLLRVWQPVAIPESEEVRSMAAVGGRAAEFVDGGVPEPAGGYRTWLAFSPYLLIVALLRVPAGRAFGAMVGVVKKFRWTIVTVMTVLALAYVMNFSGQTVTLGLALAATGGFFAFLSPAVGWIGVAVTGPDTSSNSLFGLLQVTVAQQTGINEYLLAAANTSGGVLGKMISPQNLAIAAAVVGLEGQESRVLRSVWKWSLLLLGMCVLIYVQSTAVLGWMVVQ